MQLCFCNQWLAKVLLNSWFSRQHVNHALASCHMMNIWLNLFFFWIFQVRLHFNSSVYIRNILISHKWCRTVVQYFYIYIPASVCIIKVAIYKPCLWLRFYTTCFAFCIQRTVTGNCKKVFLTALLQWTLACGHCLCSPRLHLFEQNTVKTAILWNIMKIFRIT